MVQQVQKVRILLYTGKPDWLSSTMRNNAIKPHGRVFGDGEGTITEISSETLATLQGTAKPLQSYDVQTDSMQPVTQADVNRWTTIEAAYAQISHNLQQVTKTMESLKRELAEKASS